MDIVFTYWLEITFSECAGSKNNKKAPISKQKDDSSTPVFNNLLIAFSIIFFPLIRYKSFEKKEKAKSQ